MNENIRKLIKEINEINKNYCVYCALDDEIGRYFEIALGELDETTLPCRSYDVIDEYYCDYDKNYEENILKILKQYKDKIQSLTKMKG